MKARAHVLVSGDVQGVFFRATTRDMASRLGLGGWVRNTSSGKVEAVFEGDREKVQEMVEFCTRGPPGAHVDDVEVRWEKGVEGSVGFSIRY
jgi:acylphosphatase